MKKSEWSKVTSGVPQGSVLGPLSFIIYINDLDINIASKISKFADDTKLCHRAVTTEDKNEIQKDIDTLVEWGKNWQMEFNETKCTVIHIGNNNKNFEYKIGETPLKTVTEQRDLGIIINQDLKWDNQVDNCVKKANRVNGFIARNIGNKTKDIILPLHKSLVRPLVEFAAPLWSPDLVKHINKIERVQRKSTKMIQGLRHNTYSQRIKSLELITLEQRRLRGQLIETFKYLRGFTTVNPSALFDLDTDKRTRNNGYKLKRKQTRSTMSFNFYTNKIVKVWNDLPWEVVNSASVNTFKNRLDKHWTCLPPKLKFVE